MGRAGAPVVEDVRCPASGTTQLLQRLGRGEQRRAIWPGPARQPLRHLAAPALDASVGTVTELADGREHYRCNARGWPVDQWLARDEFWAGSLEQLGRHLTRPGDRRRRNCHPRRASSIR
jgi:hypothetical protein